MLGSTIKIVFGVLLFMDRTMDLNKEKRREGYKCVQNMVLVKNVTNKMDR
jgi:hypothetical protein